MTTLDLPGPKCAAWIERDREHLSPSTTRPYPFVMDRGQGAEAWDLDGNRFLDFCAGIAVCATGHSHPKVVRAIQEQAARFLHMSGADFYYPPQIELAEKLNALAPMAEKTRVFYTNSGTESIEAALKLARYHTRRPRMLAYISAFHGRTMGSLSLTASKPVQREGFAPLVPGVTHVPFGYCYRCPYHLEYPACDIYCVRYIEETGFDFVVLGRRGHGFVHRLRWTSTAHKVIACANCPVIVCPTSAEETVKVTPDVPEASDVV